MHKYLSPPQKSRNHPNWCCVVPDLLSAVSWFAILAQSRACRTPEFLFLLLLQVKTHRLSFKVFSQLNFHHFICIYILKLPDVYQRARELWLRLYSCEKDSLQRITKLVTKPDEYFWVDVVILIFEYFCGMEMYSI